MENQKLEKHIEALKIELLALMRFQYAFDRISNQGGFTNVSRSEFIDKLISLKAIENDMLIRICKLDDNGTNVHSLKTAFREIPLTHAKRAEIEKNITVFSKAIEKVKKVRRNKQLAHLDIGHKDDQFEPCYEFKPVIKLILETIDIIDGFQTAYTWRDGSHEQYNLRDVVFN